MLAADDFILQNAYDPLVALAGWRALLWLAPAGLAMKALMRLREQFKHPESGTEIWNSDQACVTAGKEKASKQAR
jgi:hypothetical protein